MPVFVDDASLAAETSLEAGLMIGLVNNMPDAAIESTERQFVDLLRVAAADLPVRLRLFALPEVPRSTSGQQHMRDTCAPIQELWNSPLDGLIVTGTEPRAASLTDEPYWDALTQLMHWAEQNTASSVWSCLAAHAAVLHLDGIERRPLEDKEFGMFDCHVVADHPLVAGISGQIRIPHSRWNALSEPDLLQHGYLVLTRSAEAGVDTFVKQRNSLFVFFQGHPEYDQAALLREHRRDIGRFLRRERESYPTMPRGYFDPLSVNVLTAFRDIAVQKRREDLLGSFPFDLLESRLEHTARAPLVQLYANWLACLRTLKVQRQLSARVSSRRDRADKISPLPGVV